MSLSIGVEFSVGEVGDWVGSMVGLGVEFVDGTGVEGVEGVEIVGSVVGETDGVFEGPELG